jgi:hypothetical protein
MLRPSMSITKSTSPTITMQILVTLNGCSSKMVWSHSFHDHDFLCQNDRDCAYLPHVQVVITQTTITILISKGVNLCPYGCAWLHSNVWPFLYVSVPDLSLHYCEFTPPHGSNFLIPIATPTIGTKYCVILFIHEVYQYWMHIWQDVKENMRQFLRDLDNIPGSIISTHKT